MRFVHSFKKISRQFFSFSGERKITASKFVKITHIVHISYVGLFQWERSLIQSKVVCLSELFYRVLSVFQNAYGRQCLSVRTFYRGSYMCVWGISEEDVCQNALSGIRLSVRTLLNRAVCLSEHSQRAMSVCLNTLNGSCMSVRAI